MGIKHKAILMRVPTQFTQRICFLITLVGVAGSLYFSEAMDLAPCVLCWYQRILFYPLLIIYLVALWTEDSKSQKYIFPFVGLGILVAAYHNLLYFRFIPESISPCTQGVSCTTKQLELFGFITIPLMSLFGFMTIGLLEFIGKKEVRNEK